MTSFHLRRLLLHPLGHSTPTTIGIHRSFSSSPSPSPPLTPETTLLPTTTLTTAKSIATLLQDKTSKTPVPQRLDHHFSQITPTQSLYQQVLSQSKVLDIGRHVLAFHNWVSSREGFTPTDETYSCLVGYLAGRHDFKMIHKLLTDAKKNELEVVGPLTFKVFVEKLVKAGREGKVVELFEKMGDEYGFVRSKASLKVVVSVLCENGHGNIAEKLVNGVAHEFFPDEEICDMLVKGWCVDGKLDEAKRLAGEMYRGGFEIGVTAYNSILECVCTLCREKDVLRMREEAEKVLFDMDVAGVPRNVGTFNVFMTNLCKVRMTEEALGLFEKMEEWGCVPDETSYLVLIRSLYQAARIGEGDEMIKKMKAAGFGEFLDAQEYYGFLKILTGIERIDHALKVFREMKYDCIKPGVNCYELLVRKLCARGRSKHAKVLVEDAKKRKVPFVMKEYKMDPRFVKKEVVRVERNCKGLTLPEKTRKKNKKLKMIRLSFVKKPRKNARRQAY